ncbi:MAG TPA: single-stranded DNA-binding protein [Motilibacterales bacterium]|nr:single-stranded DNA-binding protein [Motilibacterales bacterium]
MNETMMTVAGNLVSDVDFRVTTRGDALARFRVASTVKRYDKASGRWLDGDTTYWNVTAWRRAAENAAKSLAKGHPVVVHGKVRQRTVDREVAGAPGATMAVTFTDLEAVSFGLDLTRCRAQFLRAPIGPQTGTAQGDMVGGDAAGVHTGDAGAQGGDASPTVVGSPGMAVQGMAEGRVDAA